MSGTIYFPILVLLVGLVLFLWWRGRKEGVAEVGRIMFFCGMLVVTWMFATKLLKL